MIENYSAWLGRVQFEGDLDAFCAAVRVLFDMQQQLAKEEGKKTVNPHALIRARQLANGVQFEHACSCGKLFYGLTVEEVSKFYNAHLPKPPTRLYGHKVTGSGLKQSGSNPQLVHHFMSCSCGEIFRGHGKKEVEWSFYNQEHKQIELPKPLWDSPTIFEHASMVPVVRRPRVVKLLEGHEQRDRQSDPWTVDELLSMAVSSDACELSGDDPEPPAFRGPMHELFVALRIMDILGIADGFGRILNDIEAFEKRRQDVEAAMRKQSVWGQQYGQRSQALTRLLRPGEIITENRRPDGAVDLTLGYMGPNGIPLQRVAHFTRIELEEFTIDQIIRMAIDRLNLNGRSSPGAAFGRAVPHAIYGSSPMVEESVRRANESQAEISQDPGPRFSIWGDQRR